MLNLEKALARFFDNRMEGFETAVPGVITKVNGDGTVNARPSIRNCLRNMQYEPDDPKTGDIAEICGVPVLYPGTDAAIVEFELKPGDPVLLVASSRDLRNWIEKGWAAGTTVPMSFAGCDEHSFMAMPVRRLKHYGKNKITIHVGNDGTVTITTEKVKIKGNLSVDGEIESTGAISSDMEVTAMAKTLQIPLSAHIHPTSVGPSDLPQKAGA